jgi:hypothetical protein
MLVFYVSFHLCCRPRFSWFGSSFVFFDCVLDGCLDIKKVLGGCDVGVLEW